MQELKEQKGCCREGGNKCCHICCSTWYFSNSSSLAWGERIYINLSGGLVVVLENGSHSICEVVLLYCQPPF
jgi:hypothetical protein